MSTPSDILFDPQSIPLPASPTPSSPSSSPQLPQPQPPTSDSPPPLPPSPPPLPPSPPPASTSEDVEMLAKTMGFSNFNTTKGKPVAGNKVGAVHVVKKRRYRQYMNRKGGFNRPLDKLH